jgi:hypothetical protein
MSMGTQFHRIGARGPRYACTLDGVACQAVQDFFEITAPATSDVRIREIKIGQYTDFGDAHSDLVSIVVRTGYTKAGSGGSTVIPVKLGHRSSATPSAGSTVKRNNTTVATGGSSLEPLADVWNIMAAFLYAPSEEDEMIHIKPGERCVIRLASALTDSITVNATVIIGFGTPA